MSSRFEHPDTPEEPLSMTNRLVADDFEGSWEDLPPIKLPDRCAFFVRNDLEALRAVRHQRDHQRELLIAPEALWEFHVVKRLLDMGLHVVTDSGATVEVPSEQRDTDPGRVWVLTSDDEEPQPHTLDTLLVERERPEAGTRKNLHTPGSLEWWHETMVALAHPGMTMVCEGETA